MAPVIGEPESAPGDEWEGFIGPGEASVESESDVDSPTCIACVKLGRESAEDEWAKTGEGEV